MSATIVSLGRHGEAVGRAPLLTGAPAAPTDPRPVALALEDPARLAEAYGHVLAAGGCPLVLSPLLPAAARASIAREAGASALVDEGGAHPLLAAGPRLPGPGHLLCTSGTTGAPGAYFFPLEVALANARAHLASLGAGAGERALLPMPLSHAFGLVAGALACAATDATLLAFAATPDPSTLLAAAAAHGATLLYLTPPLARLLIRRCRRQAPPSLPMLRRLSIGSAPIGRGELRELMAFFPAARFFATYGLTELGPRVATFDAGTGPPLEEPERPVPLGAPLAGVSFVVRDGELWVESPFASAGRWEGGRLVPLGSSVPTRDAAAAGDRGIEIRGRTDGTIVMGGVNVHPADVERIADATDGIAASCLVGRPSALYGEVPVLVCEPAGGLAPDELRVALLARLRAALPRTHVPAELIFVPALPRTASGKVAVAAVRALCRQLPGVAP